MVAFPETSRSASPAHAQACVRSLTSAQHRYHRNQQYSVIAMTGGSAAIQERYAYTAYGAPTITDASGTPRTATAEGNRYTYTGREWDEELSLYHYRARMYDPVAGRFLGRDPIGFEGSQWSLYEHVDGRPLIGGDPFGLDGPFGNGANGPLGPANPAPFGDPTWEEVIGVTILIASCIPIGKALGTGGKCCKWAWTKVRPAKPIRPPFKGKPNTTIQGKKQSRTYGPDGKPKIDRDFPHKGGPKIERTDHSHDWPLGGTRGPARPPKPGDPPPPTGMP